MGGRIILGREHWTGKALLRRGMRSGIIRLLRIATLCIYSVMGQKRRGASGCV
jgi:hypothetical protein